MKDFRLSDIAHNPPRDVADELAFHIDMRAEELMATGVSREDAYRQARESFGNRTRIEAECRELREDRSRVLRQREWWTEIRDDARFALRVIRRAPVFALAAILTLALGFGGAIAGFTLVNGVLLRPLPYGDPDRLAMVWMTGRTGDVTHTEWPFSIANFVDLSARQQTLSTLAAFRAWPYALRGDDAAGGATAPSEIVPSARVTSALFATLGVAPILGRGFTEADGKTGAAPVVVISNDLWRRRFGGSRDVIGKRVVLSGDAVTIVGVMPAGFAFPRGAELPGGFQFAPRTELWTPMIFTERELQQRGTGNIAIVARLKDGTTLDAAGADVARVVSGLIRDYPRYFNPGSSARVATVAAQAAEPVRRGLLLLMAAVSVVMVIACVNIANLLVARASVRTHELSVRRALGASNARVLRQLVTENLLITLFGAALGLATATLAVRVIIARIPAGLPRADDVAIDWRVLLVSCGVAALSGLGFGAISLLTARGGSADIVRGASQGSVTRSHRTGRRMLVAIEVALSVALLVSAGLLLRSYRRLADIAPGFDSRHAMTASLLLPITAFDQRRFGGEWTRVFGEYERRLAAAPEIASAGAISSLPLSGAIETTSYTVDGAQPIPEGRERPSAEYQVATGGWFAAAGVPLLAGRVFDTRDTRESALVIVVSAALAHAQWPEAALNDVLGRQITTGLASGSQTIIGVVGDIHQLALDAPAKPALYLPQAQFPYPFLNVVARAKDPSAPATALVPAMRRELQQVDASLALDAIRPLEDVVDASMARQRFGMLIASVFAGTALLLATIGLYGVIATGVTARRREIGVRVALGATRGNVLSTVMREGLVVGAIGIVAGLGIVSATARVLQSQLYATQVTDVAIYTGVAAITALVAFVATAIPAWRALKVDPVSVMR